MAPGPVVLVGRALTGLADLAVPTAIIYVGEVADTTNRLGEQTTSFFLVENFYAWCDWSSPVWLVLPSLTGPPQFDWSTPV